MGFACPGDGMVKKTKSEQGFTLIELALVMLALGSVAAGALVITPTQIQKVRRADTQERMDLIMNALSAYAQRHYRLPCPADPNTAGAMRGMERSGGNCFQNPNDETLYSNATGIIPWRELGLAEGDVMDAWGRYITYKPAPQLTVNTYTREMLVSGNQEIHNACRNQTWYSTTRQHLNRQKALFCCNAPPKTDYLASVGGNALSGTWRRNAISIAGVDTDNNDDITQDDVVSSNQWIDDYAATDTGGTLYTAGTFEVPYDGQGGGAADFPLLRASGHAVTLISHGGNGSFAFLRRQDANTRMDATMNAGTAPTESYAGLSADERKNVWPPQSYAASIGHPKSNDLAGGLVFDPLGLGNGASDDMVSFLRSDQVFARAGTATCVGHGGTFTCPAFSYNNFSYILDDSGSMTERFDQVCINPSGDPATCAKRWRNRMEASKAALQQIIGAQIRSEAAHDESDPDKIGFTALTTGQLTEAIFFNSNDPTLMGLNGGESLELNQTVVYDTSVTPNVPIAVLNPGETYGDDPDETVETFVETPFVDIVVAEAEARVDAVTAANYTPLYNTVLQAAIQVGSGSSDEPAGIMFVSDGLDNRSNMDTKNAMLTRVQAAFNAWNLQQQAAGLVEDDGDGVVESHEYVPLQVSQALRNRATDNTLSKEEYFGMLIHGAFPNLWINIVNVNPDPLTAIGLQRIAEQTGGQHIIANDQDDITNYLEAFSGTCNADS